LFRGDNDHCTREKRYLRPDGRIVWTNVEATVARDTDGRPLHLILVVEDITTRREAEQALLELQQQLERRVADRTGELQRANSFLAESVRQRQLSEAALAASEADLRAVLANAQDAYVNVDADGIVREWNLEAEHTFGWSRHEAVGRTLDDLIVPTGAERGPWERLRGSVGSGSPPRANRRRTLPAQCRDGQVIPCEVTITRLPESGRGHLFAMFMHDISDRLAAEQRVARSEGRLAAIVNDQTEIVCRFDEKGLLVFANRACRELFGLTEDSFSRASWRDVVAPEDLPGVIERLKTMTATTPVVVTEHRIVGAVGDIRWAEFVNRGFFDAAGTVVEVQTVGRDITERKRLALRLGEATDRLQDLYDHAPCGYHSIGPDGRFMQINDVALSWLECPRDEVIGHLGPRDFTDEAGRQQFAACLPRFVEEGRVGPLEFELHGRRGTVRRVSLSATAVRDEQRRFVMSRTVMFDVTELHRMRQELLAANRQQHLMLDNDLVGIVKLKDRRAVWHNRAFGRMFGYEGNELVGQSARVLYPDEKAFAALGEAAYPVLASGQTFRAQVPMARKSGDILWIDTSGAMLSPETGESIWLMQDVTETKRHQDRIEAMAFQDMLTGLPNRTMLLDRLRQAIAASARSKRCLAVCFMDLNGFKAVNDTLGHEAGDEVLREVALRLSACVRSDDTVARLGGDEFVLLLTQLDEPADAQAVLQRAAEAVDQPVLLSDGRTARVSGAMGVAFYPFEATDATTLLQIADRAMYEAKRASRPVATGLMALQELL
jgi:diguanylate cyclase (GGDEF)-like protein/PAS domain S-box-containing protein